tara:strand:- start:1477 stop:2205 length:729 start_codon:yes stop_codon:yes gene_type:complete
MNKEILYKNHKIIFHDLLPTGWNMDKFIREGTLFQRPDHNYDDILKLLKPNSVVYDIGSYIGTYAIPMALEGMEVIAFEGFPDNYERNKLNTSPYNITVLPIAVSNKNETVFTRFNDCTDTPPEPRNITYVRLDDYMAEHSLKIPNLVKMDIEGMETIALFGMTNLLENIRPIWQIGYHKGLEDKYEEGYPGFVEVEDGGFDFTKFDNELEYMVFDQEGNRRKTLSAWGEYICIPKEKMKNG